MAIFLKMPCFHHRINTLVLANDVLEMQLKRKGMNGYLKDFKTCQSCKPYLFGVKSVLCHKVHNFL